MALLGSDPWKSRTAATPTVIGKLTSNHAVESSLSGTGAPESVPLSSERQLKGTAALSPKKTRASSWRHVVGQVYTSVMQFPSLKQFCLPLNPVNFSE